MKLWKIGIVICGILVASVFIAEVYIHIGKPVAAAFKQEGVCNTLPTGYKIMYNTITKRYGYCFPSSCGGIDVYNYKTKESAIHEACTMKIWMDKEEIQRSSWVEVKP
jgi:hypothetical protein